MRYHKENEKKTRLVEKILVTHADKRVLSRTYKEFWQMNKEKTNKVRK